LRFTALALAETPQVRGEYARPGATQGETRSHGFFFKPDGTGGGVLGLPVRLEGAPWMHLRYGSAELTPATKARLDQLGRALKGPELKDYGFEIAGHTDAAGDDGYNMTLSRRRAEAVAAYLGRAHRVPKARLEAKGYGETALAEPAEPTSPRNRRVEVRTLR